MLPRTLTQEGGRSTEKGRMTETWGMLSLVLPAVTYTEKKHTAMYTQQT